MLPAKPRNFRQLLLLVLIIPFPTLGLCQSGKPLIFGFLPSRSPVALFRQYAPLREYLTQRLRREIILETAADYPAFLRNTDNRKYDFVLTAPHFALLAIDSGKYDAPVTYTRGLAADILVPEHSPITHVRQLAGKKIALPPEGAIIGMAGRYYLNQHGLTGSSAPKYVFTNSHNASVHAMLAGEAAAAIVSVNITRQFRQKDTPIRTLATTKALPGMAFLAARDLPEGLRLAFRRTLTQMKNTPAGKTALAQMGYPGYRRAQQNEFETARPFLDMYNESRKVKRE